MKLSESQIISLLERICVDLGFCLPPDAADALASDPPETVDLFTHAVFIAEGLDPAAADRRVYLQVHEEIAAAFAAAAPERNLL